MTTTDTTRCQLIKAKSKYIDFGKSLVWWTTWPTWICKYLSVVLWIEHKHHLTWVDNKANVFTWGGDRANRVAHIANNGNWWWWTKQTNGHFPIEHEITMPLVTSLIAPCKSSRHCPLIAGGHLLSASVAANLIWSVIFIYLQVIFLPKTVWRAQHHTLL